MFRWGNNISGKNDGNVQFFKYSFSYSLTQLGPYTSVMVACIELVFQILYLDETEKGECFTLEGAEWFVLKGLGVK